ncbi:hypothetical protein BT96DRAFT_920466 [Gymnopus androsaceus JB14]|uniref:Uncharacterized protein n=1 Tax=Gymnopus androsaceus JB14 TaxID=1447944 RepID=A0A6A4HPN7_9AGAR|nr:hypothetical protein BT96DRAFT_920466 [Gymnopus androsaceus JB14]
MSHTLLQDAIVPRKRKLDSDDSFTSTSNGNGSADGQCTMTTPPKLRRIMAKCSDQNLDTSSPSAMSEAFCFKSVTDGHSAIESINAIIKHYRKTSFRILRVNLLQRDAIARMDGKACTIDDIYDMEGEVNKLAWPVCVPKDPLPPPRPSHVELPVTRVLRSSQRHSSSTPAVSRPSTPASTPAPAPASVSLPAPPLRPITITIPARKKAKAKVEPPPPAPMITFTSTFRVPVKKEPVPDRIHPYKKLPCRGDSIQTRIAKLQADPWSDASKLTPKTVFCRGCLKQVCLDKRFDYYPGFWETHKRRCQYVQSGVPKLSKAVEVATVTSASVTSDGSLRTGSNLT